MEGMEKQTAVEWLNSEVERLTTKAGIHLSWEMMDSIIRQAKEMEKEQMKDSYKQGFAYRDTWNWELEVDWDEDSRQENNQEFEQYYNETYKSE
jgi:hypothetical protein